MRGTLVELLTENIRRAGDDGPNWVRPFEDQMVRLAMDRRLDEIGSDREIAEMRADIDRQIAELRWSGSPRKSAK